MQVLTLDVEYLPATHAVQLLAPALLPVLVIEPAAQSAQAFTIDDFEYWPGAHELHELAPAFVPVFVNEPARQALHSDRPFAP